MVRVSQIVIYTFLFFIVTVSEAYGLIRILHVRYWTAPDYTRVVIDTSDEAQFRITEKDGKIFFDLEHTVFPQTLSHQYLINKPAIDKIILIPLDGKKTRVELWLTKDASAHVFKLKKILDKPHRIVIDVKLAQIEKKESEERKRFKTLKREKVIVIDPGHGGEDPGAVGRRRTKEKDVVLKISKKLKYLLERRGYRAFLTRKADYYVSFKKRLGIAREYGADLFISIHADACRRRSARGSSVYCLSTKGVTSEAARLLAESQNLSDIIGGSANDQNSEESDPITLNMVQTETINHSKAFGCSLINDLRAVNHIKFPRVQEAPFRVLKLPDITSVLVEVAYISNPKEERLLRSSSYQLKIAEALASAVSNFIPLSYKKEKKTVHGQRKKFLTSNIKQGYTIYKVKKGDVLDRIAKKYELTAETLREINGIKHKNKIYAGQKLKVPSFLYSIYVVKRGDTIAKIAADSKTSINHLLKFNTLKSRNKIYVGQKLKVPLSCSVYVVKKGDTLRKIARNSRTTIEALLELNNIEINDLLYINQKIRVPGRL